MQIRRLSIPLPVRLVLPTLALLITLITGTVLILKYHGHHADELHARIQLQSGEQALKLLLTAQANRLEMLANRVESATNTPNVWRGWLAKDLTPLTDFPSEAQDVLITWRRAGTPQPPAQGITTPLVVKGKLYLLWARGEVLSADGRPVVHVAMTSIQPALNDLLQGWSNVQVQLITQDGPKGNWSRMPAHVSTPMTPSALTDLPADMQAWLTTPSAEHPKELDGDSVADEDLRFDLPTAPGAGRIVMWLHTASSIDLPKWRDATLQISALLVTGVAILSFFLWREAAYIRSGLVRLSNWAHQATKDEFPEVPSIRGTSEMKRLTALLTRLSHYYQEREAEIRQTAFRDSLTHLPNRAYFRMRLSKDIRETQRKNRSGALLTLDIQRFKQVNVVLGQASGDLLLRKVGQRLASTLPDKRCMLGRTGGNQFSCLIPYCDEANALKMAQRLLRAMDEPFDIEGQAIDLMAQVGLALFPRDGVNADEVLSHSEAALTSARKQFQPVQIYDPSMETGAESSLTLLTELKHALEGNEFKLYLQPKIKLGTKEVIGAEALIRWPHASRGMVPPDRFIPFAEQTGFIRALSLWVVEQTAMTWKQLHLAGLDMKLSVNLSTRDLIDKELPQKLQAIAVRHGVHRGSIVLEITESATMEDPQHAQQILTRLHDMGFLLSIDDFGTGYSSLAYLKTLPVQELKIDRSFVMNMENDLNDAMIVRSTIDLAHNLGMTVVAEGLESDKGWKILDGLRCDEAQGYFISRPMPAEEFADWVHEWTAPNVQNVRLDTDFNNII